jgi:hypothetical protein
VVHRTDEINVPYKDRIDLKDKGIARDGMIDSPDDAWFAYLFYNFGSVGRIPYLVLAKWKNGCPAKGINRMVLLQS